MWNGPLNRQHTNFQWKLVRPNKSTRVDLCDLLRCNTMDTSYIVCRPLLPSATRPRSPPGQKKRSISQNFDFLPQEALLDPGID